MHSRQEAVADLAANLDAWLGLAKNQESSLLEATSRQETTAQEVYLGKAMHSHHY